MPLQEPKVPHNIMVKYVGPKKRMHVPFPADNKLPLWSMSALDEIVVFERNQGVELPPARAEALLAQSPSVFKIWGPSIKPPKAITVRKTTEPQAPVLVELTEEEVIDVEGTENTAHEAPESTDDHV